MGNKKIIRTDTLNKISKAIRDCFPNKYDLPIFYINDVPRNIDIIAGGELNNEGDIFFNVTLNLDPIDQYDCTDKVTVEYSCDDMTGTNTGTLRAYREYYDETNYEEYQGSVNLLLKKKSQLKIQIIEGNVNLIDSRITTGKIKIIDRDETQIVFEINTSGTINITPHI